MSIMTIEINDDLENRLREASVQEQRPKEELLLDALRRYLQPEESDPTTISSDAFEPLRQMIGLVPNGLTDASVHHDIRPDETE